MVPTLTANGIAPFAISYDSVAILAEFSAKHGITFPLLSDEGSRVIRRLGLINEGVREDHAFYGIKPNPRHTDLPYPGVYVLDQAGVISHKRFHESYRERDTGAGLLGRVLDIAAPVPGAARRRGCRDGYGSRRARARTRRVPSGIRRARSCGGSL